MKLIQTRWINKEKEGKLGEVKIQVRKPKKIYPEKLIKYIEKHPDAYLVEIAEEFNCSECAIREIRLDLKSEKKKKIFRKNADSDFPCSGTNLSRNKIGRAHV